MSCLNTSTCHVYTGGYLMATPWSGLVPVCIVLMNFMHLWMGGLVGGARRKYGIPYPTLYAVPGTKADYSPNPKEATALTAGDAAPKEVKLISDADAFAFNCTQRAHQNFLEQLPGFLGLLIINWFTFPTIAGWMGIAWLLFKILYVVGYRNSVNGRLWGAGSYLPQFGLYGLTIASAVFLFDKKTPY